MDLQVRNATGEMATREIAADGPPNGNVPILENYLEDYSHDGKHVPHDSGLIVGIIDQRSGIVMELEEEVKSLTEKVAGASQRFADYENEIRVLQAQLRQDRRRNARSDAASNEAEPPTTPRPSPGLSRLGSFMQNRKAAVALPSPNRERELEVALEQEQIQRLVAEKKVKEVTGEIEELSATLFQQANDMVSTERRENAALRDQIYSLEERDAKFSARLQTLEQRETDRKRRMDKLESGLKRIERANALLVPR